MSSRVHRLVLWGFASLTLVGCAAKEDGAVDGDVTDDAACQDFPIYCVEGGPSGTGVACGGRLSAGTCVGGAWICPAGMVDQRDCTCGEPGLACAPQVCTNNGPVCVDGGADADAAATPVECRGELGEVGQLCPARFDGSPEDVPPCLESGAQQVWSCDHVVALSLGVGAHGVDCYYDSSTHSLVGAMAFQDTNTLCGNSFTQSAGEVPAAACRFPPSMPTFYRPCSGG